MIEKILWFKCVLTDKQLDYLTSVAFDSGKNACGCGFYNGNTEEGNFYIYGSWCDVVRVYAALKNNGLVCIMRDTE